MNIAVVERDRRWLRQPDRSPAHRERREPVRALPGRARRREVRPGRQRRRVPRLHPDERAMRDGEPERRHVRSGRVRGVPCPRTGRSAGPESGTTCPALTPRSLMWDLLLPDRHRARRAAVRRERARRGARVRLGHLSLHAVRRELEHERRDGAGAAPVRLLLRDDAVRARRLRGARVVGQVRAAAAAAAVDRLPRGPAPPAGGRLRGGLPRRHRGRVLDPVPRAVADPRRKGVLRPLAQDGDRPQLAVLALGLGRLPREGPARPPSRPARRSRPAWSSSRSPSAGGRDAVRRSSSRR